MSGFLFATLVPEWVFTVEALGVLAVTCCVASLIKARYQPRKGNTDEPHAPESRLAVLAILCFPLLGLLTACLLTRSRTNAALEVAEAFSHCLFWGVLAGLMTGVAIQATAIARTREGIWDQELDG